MPQRTYQQSTEATGNRAGHRDWSADEIQLVEWTKREQGLIKVNSAASLSGHSIDIHNQGDQWSRRPSPVPVEWERKRQQPDEHSMFFYKAIQPIVLCTILPACCL